jgi:hypothetical protein
MDFLPAYERFLHHHQSRRIGERLRRLTEGHGYAEKLFLELVWWPAFREYDHLHPEYEVSDFRDGTRFIDFALLRPPVRLAIEIDGYGPHHLKLSRQQFSDQLIRQNHLIIDGWKVLRFSLDDVKERPRMCEQLVQQFMGRWLGGKMTNLQRLTLEEKEVMRLAIRLKRSIKTSDVCSLLEVEQQKARKLLSRLLQKELLEPHSENCQRVHGYRLSNSFLSDEYEI